MAFRAGIYYISPRSCGRRHHRNLAQKSAVELQNGESQMQLNLTKPCCVIEF